MLAIGRKGFQDRAIKCRDILRLPASHQAAINHHLLINPMGTRVLEVCLQRRPGCEFTLVNNTCFNERPGGVTDGGNGLNSRKERLDKLNGLFVYAKLVGVSNTTG